MMSEIDRRPTSGVVDGFKPFLGLFAVETKIRLRKWTALACPPFLCEKNSIIWSILRKRDKWTKRKSHLIGSRWR